MIAHGPGWPRYDEQAIERVAELLRAGRSFDYGPGPETTELEELFSARYGGRLALSFNSGTSALLAAFAGLGLRRGDEVVVPTLTFPATATPLLLLGAVPILADAGEANGNVTVDSVAAQLTSRTRAVAITHLFGHPCDLDGLQTLCRDRGLSLVEDCSHAHGSTLGGRAVGTVGDVAVFSTGAMKLVSGGMGGVLLTDDEAIYDRACLLGHFKQRSRASVHAPALRELADAGLGGNLRMAPTAAVLASGHMRLLDELVRWKARNVERLLAAFDGTEAIAPLPRAPQATMGGWHDIVVHVDADQSGWDRDRLVAALRERGVRAREPATRPLHREPLFRGRLPAGLLDYDDAVRLRAFDVAPSALPVAERLHASWISLPSEHFNDEEGALVGPYVEAIRSVLETGPA